MTVTIYIDILLCVNLIINYYILSFCFRYSGHKISRAATLRGAAAGAALSFIILLPEMPVILSIPIKLVSSVITVFAASLKCPVKVFIRLTCVFIGISFAMCGAVYFLCGTFLSGFLHVQNGIIYAEIPPLLLIAVTSACYIIISLIDRFSQKALPRCFYCKLEITVNDAKHEYFGKIDSGNTLKEPFSQSPVIIVSDDSLLKGIPPSRLRQIPYEVIGGKGLLTGVKADHVSIDGVAVTRDIYIAPGGAALTAGGTDALLGAQLLGYINDNFNREEKTDENKTGYPKDIGKDKAEILR